LRAIEVKIYSIIQQQQQAQKKWCHFKISWVFYDYAHRSNFLDEVCNILDQPVEESSVVRKEMVCFFVNLQLTSFSSSSQPNLLWISEVLFSIDK
jgi:hypothetical protein